MESVVCQTDMGQYLLTYALAGQSFIRNAARSNFIDQGWRTNAMVISRFTDFENSIRAGNIVP